MCFILLEIFGILVVDVSTVVLPVIQNVHAVVVGVGGSLVGDYKVGVVAGVLKVAIHHVD